MTDSTKRTYVKYAGASLAALSLGVGGSVAVNNGVARSVAPNDLQTGTGTAPVQQQVRPTSGDRLDYERNEAGDIEFDFEGVSLESTDADIELDDLDTNLRFESNVDGEELELTFDDGTVAVDLELRDNGAQVDFSASTGSDFIDFEFNEADVEFESINSPQSFEDEDDEIEYVGDSLTFEYDGESQELETSGDLLLDLQADDGLDFELTTDEILLDFDETELEYTGPTVSLEFEFEDDEPSFEAIFTGGGGGGGGGN